VRAASHNPPFSSEKSHIKDTFRFSQAKKKNWNNFGILAVCIPDLPDWKIFFYFIDFSPDLEYGV